MLWTPNLFFFFTLFFSLTSTLEGRFNPLFAAFRQQQSALSFLPTLSAEQTTGRDCCLRPSGGNNALCDITTGLIYRNQCVLNTHFVKSEGSNRSNKVETHLPVDTCGKHWQNETVTKLNLREKRQITFCTYFSSFFFPLCLFFMKKNYDTMFCTQFLTGTLFCYRVASILLHVASVDGDEITGSENCPSRPLCTSASYHSTSQWHHCVAIQHT